jgi:hypothetical protein
MLLQKAYKGHTIQAHFNTSTYCDNFIYINASMTMYEKPWILAKVNPKEQLLCVVRIWVEKDAWLYVCTSFRSVRLGPSKWTPHIEFSKKGLILFLKSCVRKVWHSSGNHPSVLTLNWPSHTTEVLTLALPRPRHRRRRPSISVIFGKTRRCLLMTPA